MPISVIPISQRAMVSTLVIDADLNLGAYKLITPAIQAPVAGALYFKDNGGVNRVGFIGAGFHVNDLYEFTAGADIDFNNNLDITGKSIIGFAGAVKQQYATAIAGNITRKILTDEGSVSSNGTADTYYPVVVCREITIPDHYVGYDNTFRVMFEAKSGLYNTLNARIHVNGAPVGTDITCAVGAYVQKSQDIGSLKAGDVITIYVKSLGVTNDVLWVKNLTVKSTDTINTTVFNEKVWP